jgi:hypothetical protein
MRRGDVEESSIEETLTSSFSFKFRCSKKTLNLISPVDTKKSLNVYAGFVNILSVNSYSSPPVGRRFISLIKKLFTRSGIVSFAIDAAFHRVPSTFIARFVSFSSEF